MLCSTTALAAGAESFTDWQDMGLYGGQIFCLAVDPENPATVYTGSWGGDGLFKSTDAGLTWKTLPSDNSSRFRNCEVFDIALDPNTATTMWVAAKQQVDVSRDRGQTWATLTVCDNRFIYCLAVDPHDTSGATVYAGTSGPYGIEQSGALYKTEDGGITWQLLLIAPYDILDVIINPGQAGEVWAVSAPWSETAGCNGLVFMSPDAGVSWRSRRSAYLPDGTPHAFGYLDEIIVDPDDPSRLFVCGDFGIARARTGGFLGAEWYWTNFQPDTMANALCIAPSAPENLYASFSEGISKSTNGGESWSSVSEAPAFLCMRADPGNPAAVYGGSVNRGVFKTQDSAATWQQTSRGIKANTIYATDIARTNPSSLLCGTLSGLYLSTGSRGWRLLNERSAYAVRFHPHDDAVLYAGFDNMLGKSTDRGATWSYCAVGDRDNEHDITAIAIAPGTPQIIFAGIGFCTGDRGEIIRIADNETDFSTAACRPVLTTDVPVNTVVVHPDNAGVMLAGTGWFYAPGTPGAVYMSSDGGLTWETGSLRNTVVNAIAIAASDPRVIYAACGESGSRYSGIYKSTDTGMSWERKINGMPPEFSASDIMVDPSDDSTVYVALYDALTEDQRTLGGVYASFDGAGYWTQIGLSDYALHDINNISPDITKTPRLRSGRGDSAQMFPAADIIAGTESGLYTVTTAGAGYVSGRIISQTTAQPVDGAIISSDSGSHGISSAGYYMLMLPSGSHTLQVTASGYLPASLQAVTVAPGESVEHNVSLQAVGQDNGSACFAELLVAGTPYGYSLPLLRSLRDRVLAQSPGGKQLADLYYTCGRDIWDSVKNNEGIRQRCLQLLLKALPCIGDYLAEQKPFAYSLLNEAALLLFDIEQSAPQNLKSRIHRIRKALTPEIINGLNGSKSLNDSKLLRSGGRRAAR